MATTVRQSLFDFVTGSSVNVGFPFAGLFALPFAVWGWRVLRRTAPLAASFAAAASLTGLAFALYARPDWTLLARYFAPYAPCAYLLLWTGLLDAERAVLAGDRKVRAAGVTGAALAACGGIIALALLGWNAAAESLSSFLWIGLALVWVAASETARALGRKAGSATTVLALLVAAYGAVGHDRSDDGARAPLLPRLHPHQPHPRRDPRSGCAITCPRDPPSRPAGSARSPTSRAIPFSIIPSASPSPRWPA